MGILSNLLDIDRSYPEFWTRYEALFQNKEKPDWTNVEFVVFDTETTGFDVHKDRVLNLGTVSISNDTILVNSSVELYIKQERFTPHTVKIHGITKMDERAEYTEAEAVELFLDTIGNKILVGHHVYFDLRMMNHMLLRQNLPELKNNCLDTEKMYKATRIKSNLVEPDYSLDTIAENYRLDVSDRHTAAGDALLTALVFLRTMRELRSEKNYSLAKLLKKFSP